MFDPCVNRIIDLIAGQIGLVQDTGSKVRVCHHPLAQLDHYLTLSSNYKQYVFLTGGFGESAYLFDKVHQFTRLRRIQTKRVGEKKG